jgi:hypothetical protein
MKGGTMRKHTFIMAGLLLMVGLLSSCGGSGAFDGPANTPKLPADPNAVIPTVLIVNQMEGFDVVRPSVWTTATYHAVNPADMRVEYMGCELFPKELFQQQQEYWGGPLDTIEMAVSVILAGSPVGSEAYGPSAPTPLVDEEFIFLVKDYQAKTYTFTQVLESRAPAMVFHQQDVLRIIAMLVQSGELGLAKAKAKYDPWWVLIEAYLNG